MRINIKDGSEYFKGLLLLMRKDRKVSDSEILLVKRLGKRLGFEESFCHNAIMEILENEYIKDAVPEFSSKELAIKFIKDGFTLTLSDKESHPSEVEWLISAAAKNGIKPNEVNRIKEQITLSSEPTERMEFDDFIIVHTP
jgi:hypothetical protein